MIRVLFCLLTLVVSTQLSAQLDSSFGLNGRIVIAKDGSINSPLDLIADYPPQLVQVENGEYYSYGIQYWSGPFLMKLDSSGKNYKMVRNSGRIRYLYEIAQFKDIFMRDILSIDDKIYLLINSFNNQPDSGLYQSQIYCYNLDLSLDTSFGNQGYVMVKSDSLNDFFIEKIASFQGGILASGGVNRRADTTRVGKVFKFDLSGNLDSSFGVNGQIEYAMKKDEGTRTLLPLKNGFLLAKNINLEFKSELYKYDSDGFPDVSFADSGVFVYENTRFAVPIIQQVVEQSTGRIVLASQLRLSSSSHNVLLIGLDSNGVLDKTFGNQGIRVLDDFSKVQLETIIALEQVEDRMYLGLSGTKGKRYHAAIGLNSDGSYIADFVSEGLLFDDNSIASDMVLDSMGRLTFLGITEARTYLFSKYLPNRIDQLNRAIYQTQIGSKVYPNPCSTYFKIVSEKPIQFYQIYDMLGRHIHSERLNSPVQQITSSIPLDDGAYILMAFAENGECLLSEPLMVR